MSTLSPSISAAIYDLAPGFRALSICVNAAPVTAPQIGSEALSKACTAVLAGEPSWAAAHIEAWDNVFKLFGAKPKRTPCSAEALRKRVLREGGLASIDPIVDLYNAVSLRYALPVGGENLTAYNGSPRLLIAEGTEPFDTMKAGEPVVEYPDLGEVIWCDDQGVTCRRWNWRQGMRTRLSVSDKKMWFILESLPAMPLVELYAAGKMLTDGLQEMMPGVQYEISLID